MPPTQQQIEAAMDALEAVRLESFTASPSTIRPFEQAQLSWRVEIDGEPRPRPTLRLRGGGWNAQVPLAGSKTVSPTSTTGYKLVAEVPLAHRDLGSVAVVVDASACLSLSDPEEEIRAKVVEKVDEFLERTSELKRRRDDSVEVDASGINIAIRLKAEVEDWADPDVNIDARITLRAVNGEPQSALAGFDAELDFPWYADVVHHTLIPAAIAVAMAQDDTEGLARGFLLKAAEEMLAGIKRRLDEAGQRLLTLGTEQDRVAYTVCPIPADGRRPSPVRDLDVAMGRVVEPPPDG